MLVAGLARETNEWIWIAVNTQYEAARASRAIPDHTATPTFLLSTPSIQRSHNGRHLRNRRRWYFGTRPSRPPIIVVFWSHRSSYRYHSPRDRLESKMGRRGSTRPLLEKAISSESRASIIAQRWP